jgi:RimJ/RimL family protein N-acetyltransferase
VPVRTTPRERETQELPLGDGMARVRPVRPDDAQLVQELFDGLSDESRRRRFFAAKPRLSRAELAYLTDVDHRRHEALIALDEATGEPLGVVRYVRTAAESPSAELAIVVADAHRRRGVGRGLIGALAAHARRAGVERFTGLVLGDNVPARRLLERSGATVARAATPDLVEIEIDLGAGSA